MKKTTTVGGRSRWGRLVRSFGFAGCGVVRLLATEPNAQIHAVASMIVVATGLWLGLDSSQWCFVLLAIGLVWVAEALNSALEALADHVAPERHPMVERAKDVAAGAVLIAAMVAAGIGVLVFGPKLVARFQ